MSAVANVADGLLRSIAARRRAVDEPRASLPVAELVAPARVSVMRYMVTTVDDSGRISDRSMIRYLGWQAAERIQVAVAVRIVIITRSSAGVERLTKQGHLRVPVGIRRRCQLIGGTRVLMAASRERGLCALYPTDVLDEALAAYHDIRNVGTDHGGH